MFRILLLLIFSGMYSQVALGAGETVLAREYEERWPFSVDQVELVCSEENAVFLVVGSDCYALNGLAIGRGCSQDFSAIQKIDESAKVHAERTYRSWQQEFGFTRVQMQQIGQICSAGLASSGVRVQTNEGIRTLSCPPSARVGDYGVQGELMHRGLLLCE